MKIRRWKCACGVGHYYDTRVCWNCDYDRLNIKAKDTIIKNLEAKIIEKLKGGNEKKN